MNKVITAIAIIATLTILAGPISKNVFALPPPIIFPFASSVNIQGNGLGDLVCTNKINYPNTQIFYHAFAPVKKLGPANGTLALIVTTASRVVGGITSGAYDPNSKTYSLSGTSTSDNVCGTVGSPFTVSGPIGSSVLIIMTGNYNFRGTGDVSVSFRNR